MRGQFFAAAMLVSVQALSLKPEPKKEPEHDYLALLSAQFAAFPTGGYHHQPTYHPPTPSYHQPAPTYHPRPEPVYHPEPEPVYHPEPEPVYHHPEPSYPPKDDHHAHHHDDHHDDHHKKNPYEHIIPVGGFSSFGIPPGGYQYHDVPKATREDNPFGLPSYLDWPVHAAKKEEHHHGHAYPP